jgi:hypothetical protein
MIDWIFNLGLLLILVGTLWLCYESFVPTVKPYTRVNMRDFAKRLGKK